MKKLDGESMQTLLESLLNIYEIPEEHFLNFLKNLPDDMLEEEVYNEVKKISKSQKYDVIYGFHYTRCSKNLLGNIKKRGLLNALEAMDFIFDDIYFYFKNYISKNDYINLVSDIKNNYSNLVRKPEDDYCINAFIFNVYPYFKPHFLEKKQSPELVCDIIKEMAKKYHFFEKYHQYLKPYIIKVRLDDKHDEKYLKVLTYYFYCYIKKYENYDFYVYTITFCNNRSISTIMEVSEIYEQ